MSKIAFALLLLFLGCSTPPQVDPNVALGKCRGQMEMTFEALELYAADHGDYPDSLAALLEKGPTSGKPYLAALPSDPLGGKLKYEKADQSFVLSAFGDYSGAGAEPGFPKMTSEGEFVLKAADLTQPEDEPS